MSEHPLKLYSRSHVTTDWTCPRKRWWNYEYDGTGIVSGNTSLPLFMGTVLHDGLATIATLQLNSQPIDIDLIATTAHDTMYDGLCTLATSDDNTDGALFFASEQSALVEGLLRGFYKHVWPRLMSQYTVLCVEQEMTYEHDGLTFMSKPDLLIKDKDGNILYLEYKSTSTKKEEWINSWNTAIQLHSTCKAVEATLGQPVTGVIIQGIYKGWISFGKQSSPMCYCYRRGGNPPFTKDELSYEYKAGFKKYPVWDLEGGVKQWIDGMPEDILSEQFMQTPPIFIKDGMVNTFFEQRKWRESEIQLVKGMYEHADADGKQGMLDVAFPQRFDMCTPAWGKGCEYKKLCHGDSSNPLEQGFIRRQPHHTLEAEQQNVKQEL